MTDPETPIRECLARWHAVLDSGDAAGLDGLLAENAVFVSPVVHTPQSGRKVTRAYLAAALGLLVNDRFHYVREIANGQQAVLEFETEIDGTAINGVDIIDCDEHGRITAFKVMIRPLRAIELMHRLMAAELERGNARGSGGPPT